MTDASLVDAVTQAVVFFNDESDERIPDLLANRGTSCFQRVLVNREKLAKLVTQMRVSKGVSVDEDTVLRWVGELGVSGSPQVLSLKASICSAAEELKRVLALEQAQEVYAEFGDESSSVDLAKIKGAVRKATQTLSALQARLPSSESRYLPENDVEGNAEWRAYRRRQLVQAVNDKTVLKLHYEDKMKRGFNHDLVFKKEKAKLRKLIEQASRAIEHAKMHLDRNRLATLGVDEATGGEAAGASLSISTDEKYEVVDTYMALCRAAEAGGFQIKHDLETYISTYEGRADALLFAADFVRTNGSTDRIALGSSAQLRAAARRHRSMAARGRAQLPFLPGLPVPVLSGSFLEAAWINGAIVRTAQEQGQFHATRELERAKLQAQRDAELKAQRDKE